MCKYKRLLYWAVEQGAELNGIEPQTRPSRGTGIITARDVQAGETILVIPAKLFRSLEHIPPPISRRLPQEISLHALLAAHLALDETDKFAVPDEIPPDPSSSEASMPFLWPAELHSFLPKPVNSLVKKQLKKFQRDWATVSSEFSKISEEQYLHSWILVNTRSFYYTTPSMESLPHDDRLAFLPVADLFNHADVGCESSFSQGKYMFTADRKYRAGEGVYTCYGTHSNHFLLAEYGFVLSENQWDAVCLDDAICPGLNEEQKHALREKGFMGNYMLDSTAGACFRTQVALRMLCCTREQWEKFVDFEAEEDSSYHNARILLRQILENYAKTIHQTLNELKDLRIGQLCQRELLAKRWKQIKGMVTQTARDLSH